MNILGPDNKTFSMNRVPEEISEGDDIYYNVLNCENVDDVDYQYKPIHFVNEFNDRALEIQIRTLTKNGINTNQVLIPYNWHVIFGADGDIEVMSVEEVIGQDFKLFSINPNTDILAEYLEFDVTNVFHDFKWFCPTLRTGHFLTVPLTLGDNPKCIFITKTKQRNFDHLGLSELLLHD